MKIIDGKALAAELRSQLKEEIEKKGMEVGLAVVIVGDNPASRIYVKNKIKACGEVGIRSFSYELPADATQNEVEELLDELGRDEKVHGILLQLPLPEGLDARAALKRIPYEKVATMNLCHLIGRPLTDRIEVADDLPDLPSTPVPAADLMARPEYRLLDRKAELAREQLRLARSERLPQVGLVGNYGYLHGVELNGQNLLGGWAFTAGVQVSVPIFHFGGRSNKVRSARARFEQAQAERLDGGELLQLEATQAASNLDEAQLEIRLAESSLAAADENLRLSRRQYEAGVETLSDHLEAQAMWQQAHRTEVEARIDGYLRWLEYRKAAGLLD